MTTVLLQEKVTGHKYIHNKQLIPSMVKTVTSGIVASHKYCLRKKSLNILMQHLSAIFAGYPIWFMMCCKYLHTHTYIHTYTCYICWAFSHSSNGCSLKAVHHFSIFLLQIQLEKQQLWSPVLSGPIHAVNTIYNQ